MDPLELAALGFPPTKPLGMPRLIGAFVPDQRTATIWSLAPTKQTPTTYVPSALMPPTPLQSVEPARFGKVITPDARVQRHAWLSKEDPSTTPPSPLTPYGRMSRRRVKMGMLQVPARHFPSPAPHSVSSGAFGLMQLPLLGSQVPAT